MQHSKSGLKKQKGITLVVALIMLTVLTAMTMTVANMSTVDLKIAGNQQAAQQARNAAESGIDFLLNDAVQLDAAAPFSYINNAEETLPAAGPIVVTGTGWSASVVVKRMGDPLPCPTASLPVNVNNIDSTSIAKCVYFEVTSTGTAARNSVSEIRRGFYRKVGGFVAG